VDVIATVAPNDEAFVVELDRFHGPLELLLHLIREQDIDIFDIPIAQITAQFLDAIQGVEQLGLDRAGEFLELAATLIRIKVQMLLPRPVEETGELHDPRAELVKRLLEYEHFREAAQRLHQSELERMRLFARGYIPPRKEPERPVVPELQIIWDDVIAAAFAVGERYRPPAEHRVATRPVPVEEKIALIVHTLAQVARVEFKKLVAPFANRLHTAVTFVAGLELAKRHQVALRQHEPFGPLWIFKRKEQTADETQPDNRGAALRE
jgi:segregation and condensation protein A